VIFTVAELLEFIVYVWLILNLPLHQLSFSMKNVAAAEPE